MHTYILILVFLSILWIAAFFANGKELLSPASIVCLMFVFSAVLCLCGYGSWIASPLCAKTILITLTGCFFFSLGGMLAYHRRYGEAVQSGAPQRKDRYRQYDVSVSIWKILVILLVFAVVWYVRISSLKRLALEQNAPYASLRELTKWYRLTYNKLFGAGTIRAGVGETLLEKQILKFGFAIPSVGISMMLLGISNRDRRMIAGSVVIVFLSLLYTGMTSGARGEIIFKIITLFYGIYIFQIKKGKSIQATNRRFLLIGLVIVLSILPLFYYASALVGRKTDHGFLDYISFYFGCGIPSLDIALRKGIPAHPFGQNVFYGVYILLYKIGAIEHLNGYANEWVNMNGFGSNVYTAWYRYYADFGVPGLIALPLVYGYAATWLHQKIKYGNSIVLLSVFSHWGGSIFDLSRDDYLFGQYIATSPVIVLALVIVISCWLFRPCKASPAPGGVAAPTAESSETQKDP